VSGSTVTVTVAVTLSPAGIVSKRISLSPVTKTLASLVAAVTVAQSVSTVGVSASDCSGVSPVFVT